MGFLSRPLTTTVDGILVVGSDAGCGKTVATAGLAASILAAGTRVQAFKPLEFAEDIGFYKGQDQVYLNRVTQQFIQADTTSAPSPWELSMPLWNRMLEYCKTMQYPCLFEATGQVASPLQIIENQVVDALDLAQYLGLSVLLVSRSGPDFFEKTRSALSFIQARKITPVGFIAVQTSATASPDLAAGSLLLTHQFVVPFLGELTYSPSISVPGQQQGNLIRQTQDSIDLLPLQMGLGARR